MSINLVVFMGGASVEHEVSVISAVQAISYFNKDKYNILPVYISKDSEFYYSDSFKDISVFKNIKEALKKADKIDFTRENGKVFAYKSKRNLLKNKPLFEMDFAFPVVHGTNCEDGTLQGYLELLGVPYAECDITSSAIGMDKFIFKCVVAESGIPVLPSVCFTAREWFEHSDRIIEKITDLDFPVIVKPANLGSSVGIKKVNQVEELKDAIEYASSFASKILVEHAVENLREFNCSVLGDVDKAEASAVDEPFMQDEILSYNDKYMASDSSKGMSSLKRKLPADISDQKTKEIQELSIATFKALGCCGVVRVDFLMDCDNNEKLYVNEINTIPGSLSFYLWQASGLKYSDMLDRLVELGFKRFRNKQNLNFNYDTEILSSCGGFGAKGFKKG